MKRLASLMASIGLLFFSSAITAQTTTSDLNSNNSNFKLKAVAEIGYLAVLSHKIQFSNSGTEIDYTSDGGQDNLFPVSRISLEGQLNRKNTIILLYQPLRIETQTLLERDLVIDDLTYPAGSGVNFLYGFPFYRISYLREFMADNEKTNFALGLTVQIRNATITFESLDGTLFRRNSDIGIVPALKLRTRTNLNEKVFLELEADGIYAPVSYLNGSDNEIVGVILDASTRVGYQLNNSVTSYLNLRYLGGGAVGTDPDFTGPGDGYVKNWLHFLTVTTGFTYSF